MLCNSGNTETKYEALLHTMTWKLSKCSFLRSNWKSITDLHRKLKCLVWIRLSCFSTSPQSHPHLQTSCWSNPLPILPVSQTYKSLSILGWLQRLVITEIIMVNDCNYMQRHHKPQRTAGTCEVFLQLMQLQNEFQLNLLPGSERSDMSDRK